MIRTADLRVNSRTDARRLRDGGAHVEPNPEAATRFPLSVLVPTRNEAENVDVLIRRLSEALQGIRAELLFIDDSDDSTPDVINNAMRGRSTADPMQIKLLHRRPDERDGRLGGAIVAGLIEARGTWVCVMDGDLQHPPETILTMLSTAESQHATFVVASRYRDGGDSAGLGSIQRRVLSRAASGAAKVTFPRALRSVSDPMSGFFLFRRDEVDYRALRPQGFKILMEIAVRSPNLRIAEVPFTFAERHAGASNANYLEGIRFARHLARLRVDLLRQRLRASRDERRVDSLPDQSTGTSTALPAVGGFLVLLADSGFVPRRRRRSRGPGGAGRQPGRQGPTRRGPGETTPRRGKAPSDPRANGRRAAHNHRFRTGKESHVRRTEPAARVRNSRRRFRLRVLVGGGLTRRRRPVARTRGLVARTSPGS